jgi:hypothetical protein
MPTPTATKTAAVLLADLPQPHAHVAWNALSLCSSIDSEERLIRDPETRGHIAALLNETARACRQAAERLNLSPAQAETLRQLQANEPRHTGN